MKLYYSQTEDRRSGTMTQEMIEYWKLELKKIQSSVAGTKVITVKLSHKLYHTQDIQSTCTILQTVHYLVYSSNPFRIFGNINKDIFIFLNLLPLIV